MSQLLVNLSLLSTQPTGLTTYAANLVPYLKPLNPTLLIATSIADFSCHPVPSGITSDQGSKGHVKRLGWTQFQLPKIYRSHNASLLFSPVPEAPLGTHCRFIVTVHDLIPLRFPKRFSPLTFYARYYIPEVLRQAEHIICNSIATAQDIHQFYQIPGSKVTPILLAHDTKNFRFLNLPTQNYFLYLGRIDPYKNVSRLLSAFAMTTDAELWLAGPLDHRYIPILNAQIDQLALGDRVRFLGYLTYEDVPKVLNQAIALVFPSLWEGFGLPVLEAMACGTPVIASNLSSLPEVTGDVALLVDPTDVGAIAEAMKTLITDQQLWQKLRIESLSRASQFSWAKTGEETIAVLQRFL
jgi:glycosyltransferase involved in cell wall biosynthesis